MLKKIIRFILMLIFLFFLSVSVGDISFAAGPGMMTGDAEFDTILGDINVRTHGDNLSDFISNLSVSYKVPEIEIKNMLFTLKMSPADTFMAVGLASVASRPVSYVVEEYKANKGKGWGVIAKNLGIKPGSKEFKALKNGGSEHLSKMKKKDKSKKNNEGKNANKHEKGKKGKKK